MITYPDQNELRRLFDYCPETGQFFRKFSSRKWKEGSIAGGRSSGRIYLDIDHKKYLAHRCAWIWVHGSVPEMEVDHVNRNPLDNRLANLRLATRSENSRNRGAQANNTLGVKGVYPHQGKFRARVVVDGGKVLDKCFDTIEEASEAYNLAASEGHGEFFLASNTH